ncbi:MAG: helix-turn-helix transcriptional regulator [Akkermansiaceae bacterium]|nr:helix-turn-helix transcriptional regulator [Armatimonadota bacterium]
MDEAKKDGKKKGGKSRNEAGMTPPIEIGASDISRLVGSLHDRLGALTFEVNALRSDLGSAKVGKGKRSGGAIPAKTALTVTSPDALLDALQAEAQAARANTSDIVAVVLTAFAQAPMRDDAETTTVQTTILHLDADASRQGEAQMERESALSERAARIAASLGAEPRVLIARLLLMDFPLTATELGTGADLTTGSLYHHLREMIHAGVLQVVSRNRYALTPLGRRALLSLLAFAQYAP